MTTPTDPRQRYLDIAARRFGETGFHGVSLAAIAQEAGVTKQALLHFFATKQRLYAEVLSRLSERLCAEIAAVDAETPADRLVAFFDAQARGALTTPDASRLVARALLDSDAAARRWPLKPYLDALTALALETPRWRGAAREDALAGLYQLIGAVQFFAISAATLRGMYGDAAFSAIEARFVDDVRAAAAAFVAPPGETLGETPNIAPM